MIHRDLSLEKALEITRANNSARIRRDSWSNREYYLSYFDGEEVFVALADLLATDWIVEVPDKPRTVYIGEVNGELNLRTAQMTEMGCRRNQTSKGFDGIPEFRVVEFREVV
jgi:hypothetical protein